MQIRDANVEDVPELAALKPPATIHTDRIGDAGRGGVPYLVAEVQGAVVGFGVLVLEVPAHWPPVRCVPQAMDLMVRSDLRRRGIGTALLRHAESLARDAGAECLHLGVDPDANADALRLYLRLGYERLDEEPIEERWSFRDSDANLHEGVEHLVYLRRTL